jgi:DNA-nicking Smr family endonuclease
MSDKKTVSEDDMSLFRDAVGEVKPVQNDRVHATPPRPAVPRLRQREADERSVMESLLSELSENDFLETGEHLAWTRPGVQRSVLRKLKSGKYSVQGELDLHGLIVEEARAELSGFLSAARVERRLCVRVIHGKGIGRGDKGPRLKPAVNAWLQRSKHVLAFCSARTSDGGTGAVYVLLRRPEE